MTDLPPPPGPVGPGASPPPPPPPRDLFGTSTAPPPPQDHRTLQRVGTLATATVALVSIAAAMSIVGIWASQAAQDDAQALLDDTITPEKFVERAAPYLLMTVVQGVATVAAAVVTMIWMYRLAKNHRVLHRGGTWGPGWAIGGWFLPPPPLLIVIPFLMFRELWKASDPDTPIGHEWRTNRVSWLVPAWFVIYSVVPFALLIAQAGNGLPFGTSERDMAQQVIDNQGAVVMSAAASVAGAVVFVLLVRGLTHRHRRLTGEVDM